LTLSEGIRLRGRPAEIPDCGRDDLPDFFKSLGLKVGVEIGVAGGGFSEKLCQAGLKMYSVDPYLDYPDYSTESIQERLNSEFEKAKKRLAPYDCTLIKKTSMEAVKDFDDNSIDFVYIDGHHGFKFVTEDIYEWSKKVRRGGIISGHDYLYAYKHAMHPYVCHVKQVVLAYTSAMGIKRWYVLGLRNSPKRDQFRSWMWFNEAL